MEATSEEMTSSDSPPTESSVPMEGEQPMSEEASSDSPMDSVTAAAEEDSSSTQDASALQATQNPAETSQSMLAMAQASPTAFALMGFSDLPYGSSMLDLIGSPFESLMAMGSNRYRLRRLGGRDVLRAFIRHLNNKLPYSAYLELTGRVHLRMSFLKFKEAIKSEQLDKLLAFSYEKVSADKREPFASGNFIWEDGSYATASFTYAKERMAWRLNNFPDRLEKRDEVIVLLRRHFESLEQAKAQEAYRLYSEAFRKQTSLESFEGHWRTSPPPSSRQLYLTELYRGSETWWALVGVSDPRRPTQRLRVQMRREEDRLLLGDLPVVVPSGSAQPSR